ncbi:Uncharacterised protein [Mycobacteroides abscessus subsp. massiliense]|nr:Uncharacterised protein [Mycobacteroides abscessus subsp. massiliense]
MRLSNHIIKTLRSIHTIQSLVIHRSTSINNYSLLYHALIFSFQLKINPVLPDNTLSFQTIHFEPVLEILLIMFDHFVFLLYVYYINELLHNQISQSTEDDYLQK